MTLKEILPNHSDVKQKNRRWFQDPEMGLFAWTTEKNLVERFQLIYFAHGSENTLEWSDKNGLRNFRTETSRYRSGILSNETLAEVSILRSEFENTSAEIDPEIRKFVIDTLTIEPREQENRNLEALSSASTTEFLYLLILIFVTGLVFVSLLSTP